MNYNSVMSMLKQARSNATLYADMLVAGYTDAEFPVWWFSPAREAELRQTPAQRTLKQAEQAQEAEDGRDTQGEEGYDPTPPRTPALKEARPALPAQPSDAIPSDPIRHSAMLSQRQPPSAMLS